MSPASLSVRALRTEIVRAGDDLLSFLVARLRGELQEGDVLAVTSKIVSLAEGRVVEKTGLPKAELVAREADVHLGAGGHGVELTLKHGLLIPSAGIDESNSEGGRYILYPERPWESAARIGSFLRRELNLKNLGVILTDSHSAPLRLGVTGISLAHWGFRGTQSLVGAPDIFGQALKFTSVNVADSLATVAVFVMGEAANQCPLAVVSGAAVEFSDRTDPREIVVEPQNDLYGPLLAPKLKKS